MITLKDGIPLDPYCRYDVFEVTESGIRAVHVKPAGKREVVITVKGLHPNTRDQTVLDYFAKFGRIVTTKVVHSVYSEGPLKGFKNGDRSYKVELKPEVNIGSYHMLDEQKVTVRYSGQQQTCARCNKQPSIVLVEPWPGAVKQQVERKQTSASTFWTCEAKLATRLEK